MRRPLAPLASAILVLAALPTAGVDAGEPPPPARILEQIRAHRSGVALWWVGNAGWLVKSGDLLVGIDLDLESEERITAAPGILGGARGRDRRRVRDAPPRRPFQRPDPGEDRREATLLVRPAPDVPGRGCGRGHPRDRIVVPQPLHPFEIKGVGVRPLHAVHGNQMFTVLTREPDFVESIAHNCGYVLDLGGRTFFWPGDSVLTEEHLGLSNVNVLFVSPTVHNMYLDRSAILINVLQPDLVIPQRFGTYREDDENRFWTKGYPDELRLALSADLQKRYRKLGQGEMLLVP